MIDIEMNEQSTFALPEKANRMLSELYVTYREILKTRIFLVEILTNEYPIQVLTEIRDFNDHIAKCFLNNENESDCLKELHKAKSHLQRAIADCYKILIQIYFPDKIAFFHKQYEIIHLRMVDNGCFLPELTRLQKIAEDKSFQAKQNEFNSDGDISCEDFENAFLAYQEVLSHIEKNSSGLANAIQIVGYHSKKENRRAWKFAIISAVFSAPLGSVVTLIIKNWDAIINLFSNATQ